MSDWKFLNQHRCRVPSPSVPAVYCSTDEFGFNGLFRFTLDGRFIRCLASNGAGWEHVSISIEGDKRCPTWNIMCRVKDLFWEPDAVVVQYHPAKQNYVNFHPGCLHLWRPTIEALPCPPSYLVGPKT